MHCRRFHGDQYSFVATINDGGCLSEVKATPLGWHRTDLFAVTNFSLLRVGSLQRQIVSSESINSTVDINYGIRRINTISNQNEEGNHKGVTDDRVYSEAEMATRIQGPPNQADEGKKGERVESTLHVQELCRDMHHTSPIHHSSNERRLHDGQDDFVPQRQYYHSRSRQPMKQYDWEVDSDDLSQDEWINRHGEGVSGRMRQILGNLCRDVGENSNHLLALFPTLIVDQS